MPTEKWCNGVHAGTMILVWNKELNKTLMLKRKGDHGSGLWSVPGGWIDNGEEPLNSALRELAEEVGDIVVENVTPVAVTNDIHPEGVHSITFIYAAEYVSGTPELLEPDKATALEWMNPNEIPLDEIFLPLRNLATGNISVLGDGFVVDTSYSHSEPLRTAPVAAEKYSVGDARQANADWFDMVKVANHRLGGLERRGD